ncbi:MAG TPA: DUF4340 domain-containing protein [Stellaceae bacterium]|nr:DUF4340 domain-containing protein [Stellaceae bacterium]
MHRRSFNLLRLAALALAVWAAYALWTGDRAVSRPPPGQKALPGFADKLGELAWMRIVHGPTKENFSLVNGSWVVVEKGNYPAAAERVRKLLVGLADLTLVEPKTDRVELLPRLDLDDPANGKSTLVTVQDRTGALVGQVVIGRRRPNNIGGGDAGVYVRRADSNQAWLARGSFDLGGDVLSWLDRRIIDVPTARIASVVLTAADGAALTLSRAKPDAEFAVEGAPEGTKFKPQAALAAPAGALAALDLDNVKPAAELAIPTNGVATAAFTTFDGLIIGLRLSPPGDTDWIALDATGFDQGEAEAKSLGERLSHWSFAIPAARAKLLRTTLSDLTTSDGS